MVVRVMNSRLLFLRFLRKIVKANNQRTDSFSLVCCAKCSFVPKAKPDSCKITFPALSGFCCSSFFFFISRISFSIFYNQKEFGPLEAWINDIVWTSFTPSSATSCQTRFPALTSPPVLSHAFFADLRVIPLSTRSIRNRVCASINNIDVATPSHQKSQDDDDDDFVPMPMVLIDQDADPEATIVQLSFGDRLGALIDTVSGFYRLFCIRNRVCASINNIDVATPSHQKSQDDDDDDFVPMPMVLIDQDADPEATIVQLSFGDRLGALIDTMRALKDFGLGVTKGTVSTEGSVKQTKFSITKLDTGRKVEDPDSLEQIRLTIINNLLKYHPECSDQLAMGETFGIKAPQKKVNVYYTTSLLCIETADRPGLVVEMIKVMADINIDVESAEIDTEGLVAKDKFHVSYQGQALNSSLSQVLVNCLRYFLRRPETDIDSY
ncbi:hypothetical protein F2Q70_00006680 [Brassica cretica]|uniref:ACT domain-containing protein ACR n=1 Tax=Brassica cretica TaxID=69181 RepID=A0A8S9IR93_BRACR|nr:hypothetical protein F2Q70_00006680 [Brassica cretica]